MTTTAKISCRISATAPGLTFVARLDDKIMFQGDAYGEHTISIDLDDNDCEHQLLFQLAGKTASHTKIDDWGKILSDVTVNVQDLSFDGIALGQLLVDHAEYRHDSNGTGPQVQEKFYGTMGCNGTVTLAFTTPIYLWLLENM